MEYLPVGGREEESSFVMRTLSGILAGILGGVILTAFLLVPAYRWWLVWLNAACWGTASWGTFALARAYRELSHSNQVTKNSRFRGGEVHRILQERALTLNRYCKAQVILQNGGWPLRDPTFPDQGDEAYAQQVALERRYQNEQLEVRIQCAKREYWATARAFAYFGYPVYRSWKEYLKPYQEQ